MAQISIIVKLSFVGIHHWPGAPQDKDERYLAVPHRHVFHVEAYKLVTHANRDIEFIGLKRHMQEFCDREFAGPHTFSCEQMAQHLIYHYGLSRCKVLEDNENGAEVVA